jgi:hypothetical protein
VPQEVPRENGDPHTEGEAERGGDAPEELRSEVLHGCFPATWFTKVETAWIWALLRMFVLPNAGIPPPPLVTWTATVLASGLRESRFGPAVPLAPAAARVWHEAQLAAKIWRPSA